MLPGRPWRGRGGIWHAGAVTQGEDVVESLHAEGFVNLDATALSVFAKRGRDLVQNPRLGLDEHPPA